MAKVLVGCMLLCVLGLPITSEWEFALFLFGLLCICFGRFEIKKTELKILSLLVVCKITVVLIWPSSSIEIGENILILRKKTGLMESAWPLKIQTKWRSLFLASYHDSENSETGSWSIRSPCPSELYSFHPASFWETAKYSRKVKNIHFDSLNELKAGFVNNHIYNFWEGDMHRRRMPFWLLLEFGKNTEGAKLFWKGEAIKYKKTGELESIPHENFTSRVLSQEDTNSIWYFVFFPEAWPEIRGNDPNFKNKPEEVYRNLRNNSAYPKMKFREPLFIQAGNWIRVFIILSFFFLLVAKISPPSKNSNSFPIVLGLSAFCIIKLMMHYDWGKNLLNLYPPHGGGDDGLVHEGYGLKIVESLKNRDVKEALRGCESVFWFMPGLRYFRAFEKIIFSTTNLGYTFLLCFLPITLYKLFNTQVSSKVAFLGASLFLLQPPNFNFSFSSYVTLARLGYPEPAGTLCLWIALSLIFASEFFEKKATEKHAFLSGILIFFSIAMRPNNLLPACLCVLFLFWRGLSKRNYKMLGYFIIGTSFIILLPIHNWYFGQKLYWITGTVNIALPHPPIIYLDALLEFTSGKKGHACHFVAERLQAILLKTPLAYPSWLAPWDLLGIIFRTSALLACFGIVLRLIYQPWDKLAILGSMALSVFPLMFFVFEPNPRYNILGWDLAIITFFVYASEKIKTKYTIDTNKSCKL